MTPQFVLAHRLHLIFLLQFLQAHTSHVEIQGDEGLDVAVELGLCEQVGGVGAVAEIVNYSIYHWVFLTLMIMLSN